MIEAINYLISKELIGLTSDAPLPSEKETRVDAILFSLPSTITYRTCGFKEVFVRVYFDNDIPRKKDTIITGWLERICGPYLMGAKDNKGLSIEHCSREHSEFLKRLDDPEPIGYKPFGKFIL